MLLPPTKPYAILPPPVAPVDLGFARSRVFLEGDVLTVLCRSAAPRLWVEGGVNEPMSRIEGSDQWALRLRMPDWDRAFFDYGFTANPDWLFPAGSWRGPRAPRPPAKAARLRGKLVRRTIRSAALGEPRKLFVYLPPNPAQRSLPAFFITDGAECERFARVLEPLILARRVRPCAIVGIDNGGYRGDVAKGIEESKNFRSREYVPGVDPDRFARHRRFFVEEVPAFVAKAFRISGRRADRAAMGYSDGATFLLNLAADRPGFAGAVLALSAYAPFERPLPAPRPRLFLSAGVLESPLDQYARALHARDPDSALAVYVAGHSPGQWELAFARFAPTVFPTGVESGRRERSAAPAAGRTESIRRSLEPVVRRDLQLRPYGGRGHAHWRNVCPKTQNVSTPVSSASRPRSS